MPFYGLTLNLRDDPEAIERYKEHHRQAWPIVVDSLRAIGVTGMKIFLTGRQLFMYLETGDGFNPDHDFTRLMDDPRYAAWEDLMRTMQEQLPDAGPGEWWRQMELVYDLDWPPGVRTGAW